MYTYSSTLSLAVVVLFTKSNYQLCTVSDADTASLLLEFAPSSLNINEEDVTLLPSFLTVFSVPF